MKFHQHRTNNSIMRAPPDMKNCEDLPITMIVGDDFTVRMASFWRPTSEELAQLNAGHSVCLQIWGTLHPPVLLTVEGP